MRHAIHNDAEKMAQAVRGGEHPIDLRTILIANALLWTAILGIAIPVLAAVH